MKRIFAIAILCGVTLSYPQDSKENADFKLAVNLYNDKLYDLAVEQFRQFMNLYPGTANGIEARFYYASTQRKLARNEEAKLSFQNFALAYADHPKAPEAWLAVAEILLEQKNDREAAVTYERVKTFHPRSKQAPAALQKAADVYESLGDEANCRRVVRMLTQEYSTPEVLPARLRLATFSMQDGDLESARQECKKVVDATRENALRARALTMMGKILRLQGRSVEANAALEEVVTKLRSTPSYASALLEIGALKKGLGNTADAQAAWKTVADDSVNAPASVRQEALLELAAVADGAHDAAALGFYERASRIRAARTGEALWKAGRAANGLHQSAKANSFFINAASDSLTAQRFPAVLPLAFGALVAQKEYVEAMALADRMVRIFPADEQSAIVMFGAAVVARDSLHDVDNAAERFQGLLQRFPRHALADDAQFGLGLALRRANKFSESIRAFDQLAVKFPSSEWVDDAADQIALIRAFDVRDQDAGVEQLALLIGDVVNQKQTGDLAYRLAGIYFYQLKNYEQAAAQYRFALSSALDPAKRPQAWMGIGTSFELIALREMTTGNAQFASAARLSAASAYDSLLKQIPSSEFTDEAAVRLFAIRARSLSTLVEIRALCSKLIGDIPNIRRKDIVYLTLANRLAENKNFEDAALTYKLILDKYSRPETMVEAQFRLGLTILEQGEHDSALGILTKTLEQHPDHPLSARVANTIAASLSEQGNAETAVAAIDRIHQKYFYTAFDRDADRRKGDAWYAGRNFRNAAASYELFAAQEQRSGSEEPPLDIVYRLARSYASLNDRAKAKSYFTQYVNRERNTERAGECYLALSAIAKAENNLDLAATYLQEAGRLSTQAGSSFSVSLETADLLFGDEKYSEALTRYSELAGQTKSDSLLHYLQSRAIVCYFRMDNLKEADKRFTTFVKANPGAKEYVAEFDFERGRYYFRKQDFEKAKQRFDAVMSQYGDTQIAPHALFWLGRTFELDQKLPQAAALYDSVLRRYPEHPLTPRVQLSLANAYYTLEMWNGAAKLFRTLIENDARSPDLTQFAMNNLILTYKQMGQFDGAMDLTRAFIDRYPNDPDLMDKRIDVGVLYQKLGYYDQSIVHLQSLLENGNSDLEAELRYYIGEDYYYKGEYQQAILEFLKVPYLVTKKGKVDWIATSYYMAGQSYEKMTKYGEAMTMYKQILERSGIDATFKSAAQKEIDRVNGLITKRN